jgi:hypothetical protein
MRKTTFVRPHLFCINLLCLIAFVAVSIPSFAQDAAATLPTDPKALMLLAAKTNGLTGPDIQPWHLKATYKLLDEKGNITDHGTYEEFWASPTKFKRIYAGSAFVRIEYGTDHGMVHFGAQKWPSVYLSEMRRAYVDPLPNEEQIQNSNLATRKLEVNSQRLLCISVQSNSAAQAIGPKAIATDCFQNDTPLLRKSTNSFLTVLFTHGAKFQDRYLPNELQIR